MIRNAFKITKIYYFKSEIYFFSLVTTVFILQFTLLMF